MPILGDAAYVVGYWHDLGIVECGGMGPVPLSAREIMAWQHGTGNELQFWEFNALRQMSRAYLSQAHDSEKIECPPPFGAPEQTVDRELVGKQISSMFKSMIQAKT